MAYKKIEDIFYKHLEKHLPFMTQTVIDTNAQLVFEIGVRTGNSTNALLEGLEKTNGKLISVDIQDCKNAVENNRWTFIKDNSLTVDITGINPDITYIDGNHNYDHCLKELHRFAPITKQKILVHDTTLLRSVADAIKTFLEQNKEWDYYNRTELAGLGVLTRKEGTTWTTK